MPNLQSTVASLAQTFARDFIDALRSVSLAEILGHAGGGAAKRGPVAKSSSKPAVMAATAGATGAAGKASKASGSKGAATGGKASAHKGAISADSIVAVLRTHKGGMRAELLRRELGAAKHTFNYHVAKAIAAKQITKRGVKRATTYTAR